MPQIPRDILAEAPCRVEYLRVAPDVGMPATDIISHFFDLIRNLVDRLITHQLDEDTYGTIRKSMLTKMEQRTDTSSETRLEQSDGSCSRMSIPFAPP